MSAIGLGTDFSCRDLAFPQSSPNQTGHSCSKGGLSEFRKCDVASADVQRPLTLRCGVTDQQVLSTGGAGSGQKDSVAKALLMAAFGILVGLIDMDQITA
jgi:hypothetical protein